MYHVLYKGKVGRAFGREFAIGGISVVAHEQWAGAPLCRKGRVGYNGFEAHVKVLRALERILVLDVKFFVMHIVHDHVHAAQVVSSGVALLAIFVSTLLRTKITSML